jgi:type IV pilus assembly protein PilB
MQPVWKTVDEKHKSSFLAAVKAATNLEIGVSGKAQDSRCNVDGLPLDLRVSLLPTLFGETIVLRLLDNTREFSIDNLRVPSYTMDQLERAIQHPNGVVLVSGPTGSGKTTTLFSLLGQIDRSRKKIITLEDPVEYVLPGISQVRVNSKVSFSDALRAVLRQDPDVILVGEIRDEETAALAFRAAATGHLVLSTVHANNARDVINRLSSLGVDQDSIERNLRLSAAQRLVPKICPHCSEPAPDEIVEYVCELADIDPDEDAVLRIRSEDGCDLCEDGIVGRLPVIEYVIQEDIETVMDEDNEPSIYSLTLKNATCDLAIDGVIDVREVLNVL